LVYKYAKIELTREDFFQKTWEILSLVVKSVYNFGIWYLLKYTSGPIIISLFKNAEINIDNFSINRGI